MRTEIFNSHGFSDHRKTTVCKKNKITGFRLIALSLLISIAATISCSDGAINAYMNYVPNRAPQILDLASDFSGMPVPGDIITITCKTYDPDGNPLAYAFTSSRGSFTDQADSPGSSRVTFIVGNISGGEDVSVSVRVTDSKKASVSATLNIGKSSLGPLITILEPVNRTLGADGYTLVTFRSNMDGYYQVSLPGDGIPADIIDPEKSFFKIYKDSDTVFNICGSTDSDIIDKNYMEGIPRLPTGLGNIVYIKVIDRMDQVSVREIKFNVKGATPVIEHPDLRITDLKMNSMSLNWYPATDPDKPLGDQQKDMVYSVYISTEDNIFTLEDAEHNGNILLEWKTDCYFFEVEGLTPATGYYFNVVVMDSDGVKETYNAIHIITKGSTLGPYILRYDGNNSTGGTVPDYTKYYNKGERITVLGNTGNLMRRGYIFPDGIQLLRETVQSIPWERVLPWGAEI